MSLKKHIESLHRKHKILEAQLHEAYLHHMPVNSIKKKKLLIKDEILSLLKQMEAQRANTNNRRAA